jgi:tetratricopeptide (TPR) repeat protein/transcriptional regulator with XRE-family HTH domain
MFATLLRQLRTDAGLTQEELAAAAKLSPRSISDLERGINLTARRETARLLADALRLAGTARSEFEAAARGRVPARAIQVLATEGGVAAATRTLPRDTGSFTGREPELGQLMRAAAGAADSGGIVDIHAIGGMAGIGKTTFAVHAAHRIAPSFPDGQVFLQLHAHTPGQRPVEPADALASLLLTAGVAAGHIPPGLEERSRLWRDHTAGKRLLLVLDDASGHEQIRPLLPGTAGSLVLVTSRRRLTALEDAQAISLDTLPASQAADLLIRLAARPGLRAADAAVCEIARLCGYLPLAIGMLARQLHHHPAWGAAELAAELAAARDRLELMQAENLSVAAAFDLSYQDLEPDQQRLFRRLGVHPGTDVDAYAAAALDDISLAAARRGLDVLYDQNLLAEPSRGRYRLHDLMREHAGTLAAADPAAECEAAGTRLLGYYLHAARNADRQLARRTPALLSQVNAAPPVPFPDRPGRAAAVAWMDGERLNLHAAAGYAAYHDLPGYAIALPAAMHGFLRFRGHWDQALTLHETAMESALRAGDKHAQAGALTDLGDMQYSMRNYPAAYASLARALDLYRDLGDRLGEAHALTERSTVQHLTGDNPAAADGLTRALGLYRDLRDRRGEASALSRLASVRLVTGDYAAATDGLTSALGVYRDMGDRLGEAHALNDLGAVQQATGDYRPATANHEQALALYRELGDRRGEANALSDLGTAAQATGENPAASAIFAQALALYRDLADRLGEADVLSQLGDMSLAADDPAQARARYDEARVIASQIASPLVEARALEGIGRCDIGAGRPGDGAAALREALSIYLRIGSPDSERIRGILADHGI